MTIIFMFRFAHCINLDYYMDMVNLLDKLLKEDWIGFKEQLYCIQTVFAILSGQGEALTLDPTRFYNNLYKNLLEINASSNGHKHFFIVLQILCKYQKTRFKNRLFNLFIVFEYPIIPFYTSGLFDQEEKENHKQKDTWFCEKDS